jgi:hypothetical protein
MSCQDLARQIENLGNTAVVPNTPNTVELNVPLTIDRAFTAAGTSAHTGAASFAAAVTMASTLAVTGAITASAGLNEPVQNALTALASGGQSGATQLAAGMNRITVCATAGDSVALPAATAGVIVSVVNVGATAAAIFPLGATDVIQGIAAQTAMTLASGSSIQFRCAVAGTWSVFGNVMKGCSWSTNTTTTTFAAGQLTGGIVTLYLSTATTPGSIATRTATQMFDDTPNAQVGQTYLLLVGNLSGSANTMTITAGSGVTLTGTATVAQNIGRAYIVTFTSRTALVMQEVFSFTIAA